MTSIEILNIVTSLFGGLALFLFGMGTMSESLGQMTGGILYRFTGYISRNRITAFLFGAGITAVVQSSSAVSVLTVGLVNAGVIELEKAVGILIGANLGTTVTSWLLSLNAIDGQSLLMTLMKPSTFSPFLAVIGVVIYMFAKTKKAKTTGQAILGFSVMMIGMHLMSTGVAPLKEIPALEKLLLHFSNPILGFAFSLLFTVLIQSSDASIGIVQAFALSFGVTFGTAIPLICGAQVGSCVTALIASLATSNNGKRTAFMNLYYNLLKTLPFLIVFYLLHSLFHFGFLQSHVGAVGIPLTHTLINLIGTLIWLPGAKVITMLARKTIPLSPEEQEEKANTLVILDPIFLSASSYALNMTEDAVGLLAETVRDALQILTRPTSSPDFDNTVSTLCKRAEMYSGQIAQYLVEIASHSPLDKEAPKHTLLVNANSAMGQMGSITQHILEKTNAILADNPDHQESFLNEITVFGEAVNEIFDVTVLGLKVKEPTLCTTIQIYREEISRLSSKMRLRHIEDMHKSGTYTQSRLLMTSLFNTEERMIDCCDNIADALVIYASATGAAGTVSDRSYEVKQKQIHALFEDKYRVLDLEDE